MSMWQTISAVARKEWIDGLRDRRSLMAVLGYALMGPVILFVTFTAVAERESTRTTTLYAAGLDHAPGLRTHLLESGIKLATLTTDAESAIADGEAEVALVIDDDAARDLRTGAPATVVLTHDSSRTAAAGTFRRVQGALEAWKHEWSTLRLVARGVAPDLLQPVDVAVRDIATPADRATLILGGFQVFILIAAFFGSMHICIDTTAGERERRSLEVLLVQPGSPVAMIAGKWLVASVFGLMGVVLTLVGMGVLLPITPLGELGVAYSPTVGSLALMFALVAPLAPLASGLQLLAASYARSFKEAQTYLSMLMFVPMVPAMAMTFLQLDGQLWMYVVPVLGQQQLLQDAMRETAPAAEMVALAGAVAIGLGLITVAITARLHAGERMLRGL